MRTTSYKIGPDSKGSLEDLKKIINQIEMFAQSSPLFSVPKKKALTEVLIRHSELAFMHITGHGRNLKNVSITMDQRTNEGLVQESLKWILKWIFNYCPEDNQKNKYTFPTRKEVFELFEFAYLYDLFKNLLFSTSHGSASVAIYGKKLRFVDGKNGLFLAYNAWRLAYRERELLNRIEKHGLEAIKEIQSSEFTMPEDWNFEGYSLSEFMKFSVSLDQLVVKWYKKHVENNRIIHVGKYQPKDLVKVNHLNWWVEQLSQITSISRNKVKNIIEELTYSNNFFSDPAYQFFIPLKENILALPIPFTASFVRPERNLLALIPKAKHNLFSKLSNDCESQQIELIKKEIKNVKVLVGEKKTKAQEIRKGIDILFLDTESLQLLVVELKWTVAPSSTREMYELDKKIQKGLTQMVQAKEYITSNFDDVLSEYFGTQFKGKTPIDHEYCVVVNESIGTGEECSDDAHVITVDHLVELLNIGVSHTISTLRNNKHRVPREYFSEKDMKMKLLDYEIEFFGTELKGQWLDETLPSCNSFHVLRS
ncbi:hypothetical protein C0R09_04805 [Brevibacillus laterosporus]|uniref:hypothetical protein n=1 Tax=Brevibacillus laterosporus TaxID=1465 RepID=UPI000C7897AE|nr:hypothetical protein [Brevibacillus laterosporus]AUM63890.1 hypothetical protein C0R09_04805 [Brevibacillus laterosporus]MDF9413152.1 hypothetical protein [Brevibacillus laterosporus]